MASPVSGFANFIRRSIVTPRLIQMGIRGALAFPTLILLSNSVFYYNDFMKAQSEPNFNNATHYEVYDFIIVGGGSAGAVLANRLSLHSSVLLLELGGDPHPLQSSPILVPAFFRSPGNDLMYEPVPQNHSFQGNKNHVPFWPRGTGIGGSSNLNVMIYQRGHPMDYNLWAKITKNPQWAFRNVLPYFRNLESYHGAYPSDEFHGRHGPLHIEKARRIKIDDNFISAVKEKGLPIHDTNQLQGKGFGGMELTNYKAQRWGTFPAYIKPILSRRNLHISRYSRVVKVHLDRHRHAYGVTYYRHGMKKFVRARREITLSAGAIDTPKILLLSSIGPKKHLHSVGLKCRVNLPVGKNLQDHLMTLVGPFVFDEKVSAAFNVYRDANIENLIQFAATATGPLTDVIKAIPNIGYINTPNRPDAQKYNWPDIQYFQTAFGLPDGLGQVVEQIINLDGNLFEDYMRPAIGRDVHFLFQVLARPFSRGEIKLAGKDPFLQPIIEPNYLAREEDRLAMIDGWKFVMDVYENSTIFRKMGAKYISRMKPCSHLQWKSDAYYGCVVQTFTHTAFHPVGTAAMGRDDYYRNKRNSTKIPAPVVDSQMRVFKTTGLRVIDASIMPILINANTNIPTIMIGEVGSDFIRSYWTRQSEVCPNDFRLYFEKRCRYSRLY